MSDFQPGDRFGQYHLEELLGGGGFGEVWRATHVEGGETVALKLLGGHYSEPESARINAEVELLATTAARSSRHVVRVIDGGTEPVPHVVMEYIEGGDLRAELAARGALTPDETIEIARGVLDALRVLEEAGIVHRDIKPGNVMRDADGAVKLTDFGIAKIIGYDTITATGQLPLSMAYAAPETWDGQASHQSDLYSVGVLLYQCLVGEPPFRGTYAEVYRKHLAERPDLARLPTGTPPSLRALIARCLEKAPEARPPDAAACVQLLDAAASELDDATDPRGPRPPTRIGPWLILDHHPTRRWAYRCQHEDTGQHATVEVHSSDDLALGEQLQQAVTLNGELADLGAERLLEARRVVLRPGEAWPERPPGRFEFWVARDERSGSPGVEVNRDALARAAHTLVTLRERVHEVGLPFAPATGDIAVIDGELHMRRPGLPGAEGGGDDGVLAALATWPLTAEARAALQAADALDDLAGRDRLIEDAPGGRRRSARWAGFGVAMLAAGIAAAAAVFAVVGGGGGGGDGILTPTPSATTAVEPTAEPTLPAGVPGLVVDDDFGGGAADWTLLGSAALDDGALVLTTPRGGDEGIAWLRANVDGPFVAEFDYRIGGAQNSIGGHGLVFMFYKRAADTAFGAGCLGFAAGTPCPIANLEGSADVAGYGIEFDGHLNGSGSFAGYPGDPSAAHVALIQDSPGHHLASVDDARVEDYEWHRVRVEVRDDGVTVDIDGEALLSWAGSFDRTFGGIGFAATTTTSETNWHMVDNVRVERLAGAGSVTEQPSVAVEPLLLAPLEARSCGLGETPRSLEDGAETWVEFANETEEVALVYLVGGSGLTQLSHLEPHERFVHRGAVGDRWVVTDARGDCRAAFEAETVAPAPARTWRARITAPAGTRVYRNENLGFEFLRPRDQLVRVVSSGSAGLAALALSDRVELFIVDSGGLDLDAYASAALEGAVIVRERQASIDGLPALVIEYGSTQSDADHAAAFVIRGRTAHVLTFARGSGGGCAADLSIYRLLLGTFRFLDDAPGAPTALASPAVSVRAGLCGDAVAAPSEAETSGVIASLGCGPLAPSIGDTVVCMPELTGEATLTCWSVTGATEPGPECLLGRSFLTTSFETLAPHSVELIACTVAGCEQASRVVLVGASEPAATPLIASLGCTPAFPHVGDTVTCEPEVAGGANELCWSSDDAGFLDDFEVCNAPSIEGRVVAAGTTVVHLRACSTAGACTEAAQILPVDASVAALTFLPRGVCTPAPVLMGEPPMCSAGSSDPAFAAGSLMLSRPGRYSVDLVVCLPSAPRQSAVCVAHQTVVVVGANLATGAILDGGVPVAGARVELAVPDRDPRPLLRRASTNDGGAYTLIDPPAGRYLLVVSTPLEGGGWAERASVEVQLTAEGRELLPQIDLDSDAGAD